MTIPVLPREVLIEITSHFIKTKKVGGKEAFHHRDGDKTLRALHGTCRFLRDFTRPHIFGELMLSMQPDLLQKDADFLTTGHVAPYVESLSFIISHESRRLSAELTGERDLWGFPKFNGSGGELLHDWHIVEIAIQLTRIFSVCAPRLRTLEIVNATNFVDFDSSISSIYMCNFFKSILRMLSTFRLPRLDELYLSTPDIGDVGAFCDPSEYDRIGGKLLKENMNRLRKVVFSSTAYSVGGRCVLPTHQYSNFLGFQHWVTTLPLLEELELEDIGRRERSTFVTSWGCALPLRPLRGLGKLRSLSLTETEVADSLSVLLQDLKSLKKLKLVTCAILYSRDDSWGEVFDACANLPLDNVEMSRLMYVNNKKLKKDLRNGKDICRSDRTAFNNMLESFREKCVKWTGIDQGDMNATIVTIIGDDKPQSRPSLRVL